MSLSLTQALTGILHNKSAARDVNFAFEQCAPWTDELSLSDYIYLREAAQNGDEEVHFVVEKLLQKYETEVVRYG